LEKISGEPTSEFTEDSMLIGEEIGKSAVGSPDGESTAYLKKTNG